MESFFKIKTFKSYKEVMESISKIKSFKSREKVVESFFSVNNFKSRNKVTESFFQWPCFIKLSYDAQISWNNIFSVSSDWISLTIKTI